MSASAPVSDIVRDISSDGTDVISFKLPEDVTEFTLTLRHDDPSLPKLHLSIPDKGCWEEVGQDNLNQVYWIDATWDPHSCGGGENRIWVSLGAVETHKGDEHEYLRFPPYLLTTLAGSSVEWDDHGQTFPPPLINGFPRITVYPTAPRLVLTRGDTSAVVRDDEHLVVASAGGSVTVYGDSSAVCTSNDAARGSAAPWHCESTGWLGDYDTGEYPRTVMAFLPGASYDLADANWTTIRDTYLLLAGALVGTVGAALLRLIEELAPRRRR